MSRRNLPLIITLAVILAIGVALLVWGYASMGWDPLETLSSKEAVWCYIALGAVVAVSIVIIVRDRIKRL